MKIQILPNISKQITHINSSLPKFQSQPKYNVSMKGGDEDSYWDLAMVKYDDYDDIEEEEKERIQRKKAEKQWEEARREYYRECQRNEEKRIYNNALALNKMDSKEFKDCLLSISPHEIIKYFQVKDSHGKTLMNVLNPEKSMALDEYCKHKNIEGLYSFFTEKLCNDKDEYGNNALQKFDRETLNFWNGLFSDKQSKWHELRYEYALALGTRNSSSRLPTQKNEIWSLREQNPLLYIERCTKQDSDGNLPAHILSEFGLEEMVNKLQDKPDVLEQIFTAKNNYGQLPAHLYDDYKMEIMINALKDKPELLKEIFTTQDKLLNLPAHYFTNNSEHKIMIQTLKNQPGVIPQIYTTQNYRWSLPVPNRSVRDIVLPCLAEQGEKDAARKIFTNINVNRASLGMKDLNPYFDLFKVDEKESDDLVYKFSVLDDMKKFGRFFEIADEYGFLTDLQKNAIKNFEQEPVLFL